MRGGVPLFACAGAVLLWMAQPPLGGWPLAWVAPLSWFWMAATPRSQWAGGYAWLYLAGLGYWLLTLQGLRHAHPAMFLGWFALSLYLAAYVPLAVALIRVAVRQAIPLPLAAAAVWTGLEGLRSYALTGLSINLLGHTQVDQPSVIQIADLFGSYAVSFLVAYVAGTLALLGLRPRKGSPGKPLVAVGVAVLLVVSSLGYGAWRMAQGERLQASRDPLGRILLIQRDEPVDYVMSSERHAAIFGSYVEGSRAALAGLAGPPVDLIVWPESMYSGGFPWMLLGDTPRVPEGLSLSAEAFRRQVKVQADSFRQQAAGIQRQLRLAQDSSTDPAMLVGCGVVRFDRRQEHYSGAVLIGPQGVVADWYGKRHLVLFGEYVPFARWFPGVAELLPIGSGMTPGPAAVTMEVDGCRFAPNICFETVVEPVAIEQLRELIARGEAPDVLINLTNDAWFDTSSLLAHHRRCSQLVAVACRRPLLMASNMGPTVWIDSNGQLVEQVPVGRHGSILAEPLADGRSGLYQVWGDWPVRGLTLATLALGGWGLIEDRRRRAQGRRAREPEAAGSTET